MKFPMAAMLTGILLLGAPAAQAMMAPGGGMVQSDLYDAAEALVKDGKYEDAIVKLKDVLREMPQHANAWSLYGFSSRMQGKFDEAEKYYGNALKISPENLGALNYLGQLYVQTGRIDQAREVLGRLQKACEATCIEYIQLDTAIKSGKAGNY